VFFDGAEPLEMGWAFGGSAERARNHTNEGRSVIKLALNIIDTKKVRRR
jgi:hypothetical protein